MSRSPWRDALDGQIKILRELRRDSSIVHLGRNGDIEPVRKMYAEKSKQVSLQLEIGKTLAEAVEILVREAEPVHMSHDIRQHLNRCMDRIAQHASSNPNTFDLGPLTEAMLPIPNGLLWFGGDALRVSDVPSPETTVGQVHIKGIYFGNLLGLDLYSKGTGVEIEARSPSPEQRKEMGVVVFLDARPSGYTYMSQRFGDHLVPCILGGWTYGQTLNEAITTNASLTKAITVNEKGTQILASVSFAFLHETFLLMLQRVTRWGGVGLNREERKDAEREKLRPRVQLVTWRKANYQYPEGHIPVPKNWSCRWSVRDHYRRYKSGKVVKIQSYIKGPPDRPFKLPTSRVHDVRY